MNDLSDEDLLAELGVFHETKAVGARTAKEERVIAGFEDIVNFVREHGRAPIHGAGRDIFERLYAVRLDRLRELSEFRYLLAPIDEFHLLSGGFAEAEAAYEPEDDDALLAELGIDPQAAEGVAALTHVKPRAEIRNAPDEIAKSVPCKDFERFKPLFVQVQRELDRGLRRTRRFQMDAEIKRGEFFILGGQKAYVAEVGKEFVTEQGRRNARLRVIFDNGTESDNLLRSLQRALYKDEAGRRITEPDAGPLFEAASKP
jgi:hypothetical protein